MLFHHDDSTSFMTITTSSRIISLDDTTYDISGAPLSIFFNYCDMSSFCQYCVQLLMMLLRVNIIKLPFFTYNFTNWYHFMLWELKSTTVLFRQNSQLNMN
jgi:hypothetical protein